MRDFLLIFVLGVVGCGGSVSATAPAVGEAPAVDDSVAHVQVARVSLGSGVACDPEWRTVDYDRATHAMSWPGCVAKAGAPGLPGTDYPAVSRVLSAAESAQVEDALASITYVENPECAGYDGKEYFMTTTARGGSDAHEYSARNINCYNYRLAPKIVDLYDVLAKLRG